MAKRSISQSPRGKAGKPVEPQSNVLTSIQTTRKPELTEFQKDLADLCGEIIVHGAPATVLGPFVDSLIKLDHIHDFPEEKHDEEKLDESATKQRARWLAALRRTWRKFPDSAERPEPQSIVDRIRENFREQLAERFINFECNSSPEEMHLMLDILFNWESIGRNAVYRPDVEVPLAHAFEQSLGPTSDRYLRVSWKEWERFTEHVHLLEEEVA